VAGIWTRFFGQSVSTAAGFGMGAALGPALRPITQSIANETWALHPDRPLTADEAAEAVVRAVMTLDAAEKEALATGVNAERFAVLRAITGNPPGPEEVLSLWNRGAIGEDRVDLALRQSRMRPEWYAAYKQLRRYLPSVSDLIRWGVREVFSPTQRAALDLDAEFPAELASRLGEQGYDEGDARNAWAAHWELPSRGEGAEMMFRGEISDAEYDSLLKALDYAPTWRDRLKAISAAIPTLSDMIRFAQREVYSPGQRQALGLDADYPDPFTAQAAMHGLSEEHAREYWAAHWRLPSAQQGYRMLWRDEINPGELDGLLKALDYPAVWRNRLANIAHLVPGRIDLRRMFAAGVIDRATVKKGYQRIGYTDADAETLTRFAEQQASSGSEAHQKWADRARSRLFTVTHNEYLDESLDRAAADAALETAGIPDAERPAIFAAWDHERDISRLELTPAQIKKAYKKALYTEAQALEALQTRGMSAADADTFLQS
jgi:hypothetical protein